MYNRSLNRSAMEEELTGRDRTSTLEDGVEACANTSSRPATALDPFRYIDWRLFTLYLVNVKLAAVYVLPFYYSIRTIYQIFRSLLHHSHIPILSKLPERHLVRQIRKKLSSRMLHAKSDWPRALWWLIVYLTSRSEAFELTLVSHWERQVSGRMLYVFVGGVHLKVPLVEEMDDRETLKLLRMWYRWLLVRRGFVEVILPRKLQRIDVVQVPV